LYIESVDLGLDLVETDLLDKLGIIYKSNGGVHEVNGLRGENGSLMESMYYSYQGGEDPHFNVDRLDDRDAQLLFSCDDDYGRIFINETENYSAISSSVVMGAFANGIGLNLKPYMVGEFVNYFLGITNITSLNENLELVLSGLSNYPNPFASETTIQYTLTESSKVRVDIYNLSGQVIRNLQDVEQHAGEYSLVWNADNNFGNPVESGYYFYKVTINNKSRSGKMILVK